MIYLLYGPDTFRSRRLLADIVHEFKKKAATVAPAIFWFDAEEDDLARLPRSRNTPSLFGSKELFIIERAFSSGKNVVSILEPMLGEWQKSETAIFIFWDGDAGGSAELAKVKQHAAKIQEFKILEGPKLAEWLAHEASAKNITLSSGIKQALLADCRGDLWKLAHELEKYQLGGLVAPGRKPEERKVWDFTDAFLASKKQALAAAARLLAAGNDALYLMAALGKTLRLVLALGDAEARKMEFSEVGKKMKVHPFVLRKQAESARTLAPETVAKNHRLLLFADANTKTGKLPAAIAFLNLFVK